MKKLSAILATLTLAITACTDDSARPPDTTITYETVAASLIAYDSCDALLEEVKAEAATHVGPWGFDGSAYGSSEDKMFEAAQPEAADRAAPQAGASDSTNSTATTTQSGIPGVDFSTTNVQEQGVDEPDLVKTDGNTMYVALADELRVIDLSGGSPSLTARIALPAGGSQELLLDGNRVLVLSNGYYGTDVAWSSDGSIERGSSEATGPGSAEAIPGPDSDLTPDTVAPEPPVTTETTTPPTTVDTPTTTVATTTTTVATTTTTVVSPPTPIPANSTVVTAFDVSDRANPTVVSQTAIEGNLLDARMIDGVVRIVTSSTPGDLGFVYPSGSDPAAEIRAAKANVDVINDSSVQDWLPTYTVTEGPGAGDEAQPLVRCASVSHTQDFSGFGVLSVSTLDLRGDAAIDPSRTASVQTDGEDVYASARNLYVATTSLDSNTPTASTAIHEFDLSDPGAARYMGSGTVRGTLLNQFAMSEYDGVLRVATTDWSGTGDVAPGEAPADQTEDAVASVMPVPPIEQGPSSESFVTTLRIDGGALTQVGQVGGLGRGEQIYSVRFIGDTGYVVTFRQTDPLYVVDLSDPAAPAVVGELKIPGYSSYLQPVGDGRLVGIGQDATGQGRTTGLQVALFDVSNPTDPRQVQKYTMPGGYSEAESDHHAFLWWASENLLVIPAEDYGGAMEDAAIDDMTGTVSSAPFTGAVGLNVTDGGISERGRIEHPNPASGTDPYGYDYWGYGGQIQRAVVVGNSILTVSSAGLGVNSLTDLAQQGWLPFA